MFLFRAKFLSLTAMILVIFSISVFAQKPTPTPPEDKPEVVYTEEIKINIAAFDENGNFADSLKKEDIVINEDGRLHQANIVQHIPANVLILLDTGGENRQAKNIKTTRNLAKGLISSLQSDDKIALMQYYDKVELLSDWTGDKAQLNEILNKKMNFGMRSRFINALEEATAHLEKLPAENRHLVLITDGLDTLNDQEEKILALRKLTSTNVNVHVFSYTGLERAVVAERKKNISKARPVKALPPGAGNPGDINANIAVPIATVNLDREMVRKNQERGAALIRSEKDLMKLSEDTNGIFYLPDTEEEMLEKTTHLAKNIDSQYVVTYTPKKPLSESENGEVRNIEVTSKRDGVLIQARRKLTVLSER